MDPRLVGQPIAFRGLSLLSRGHEIAQTSGKDGTSMDALVIAGTLLGSVAAAFALQKAALERLFRIMDADRRARQ